jgi:hypothetical protein
VDGGNKQFSMIEELSNQVKACENTMEKLITMCTEIKGRK